MIDTLLFDLAGTTIDCGCMAPVSGFIEVFRRRRIDVDVATARGPMGTHKREHIRRMCAVPRVVAEWHARHGHFPTEAEVDEMYLEAEPLQIACLPAHADPLPGFTSLVASLRARGFRIGATTGYTRPMVAVLAPLMAARGWSPDVLVSAGDVPAGRPAPYMNQRAAMALGETDVRRVVVFGDTLVDMEAARNAGMWAVGVALTGNEVGLSWEELSALAPDARNELRAKATTNLEEAGAHLVIDSVLDLRRALVVLERPSVSLFRRWNRAPSRKAAESR